MREGERVAMAGWRHSDTCAQCYRMNAVRQLLVDDTDPDHTHTLIAVCVVRRRGTRTSSNNKIRQKDESGWVGGWVG